MTQETEQYNGLPVHGYGPQTDDRIKIVNLHKQLEERCLRAIDAAGEAGMDPDMLSIAQENLMQGFMWLNRAVFQPTRIPLPEDGEAAGAEDPLDPTPPPPDAQTTGPRLNAKGEKRWWSWRSHRWVPFCALADDAQVRAMDSGVTVV